MTEIILESKIQTGLIVELNEVDQKLVQESKNAAILSHSPYSKFKVGCAILLEDHTIVKGANQENASYPMCLCAEGSALAAAATQYPAQKILQVAIFVPLENPASPCGFCRQSFKEYEVRMDKKFSYILAGIDRCFTFHGIDTILPLAFSANDLKIEGIE